MKSKAEWVASCIKVHGDRYDYSLLDEPKSNKKSVISCILHGSFTQTMDNHVNGRGCPKCGRLSRIKSNTISLIQYQERCHLKHDNKYEYPSWNKSTKNDTMVPIICPIHGSFMQKLDSHLCGSGCPSCGNEASAVARTRQVRPSSPNQLWLMDVELMRRLYETTSVENMATKFECDNQTIYNHLHIHGIALDVRWGSSVGERELAGYVTSLGVEVIRNDRTTISPLELDILIPDYGIAIEYCGLYWHSEQNGKSKQYHKQKYELCQAKNIRLFTIFADEWITNRTIVQNKIATTLHKREVETVFARKTKIVVPSKRDSTIFMDTYHIQGSGPGSTILGLEYDGSLVACMMFTKYNNNRFYLTRYATKYNIPGGFSKLLARFKQHMPMWSDITSFADLRWSDGNLYSKNGWDLVGIIPPDYCYSPPGGTVRVHKFNYRKQHLAKKLHHYDPALSEKQNCDLNNMLRIWDCGKLKYRQTNNKAT